RNDFPRTSVRTDVEVRGAVRGSEAEPLPRASKVPGPTQSADPGLPLRNCAEPQASALPTLLLVIRAPQVSFDQHHAGVASNRFMPINRLPNNKTYSHLFNRPDRLSSSRHPFMNVKHADNRPSWHTFFGA